MFCPSCGSEERQLSQFCRGCGMDLRAVRAGLERSDTVTSSAVTARDEIGRALASRITELRGPGDLKTLADDLLPKIADFLESPEEKRLRRMRNGVITSAVGLGAMLMFFLMALAVRNEALLVPIGAAAVVFIIGLGILINGKLLTVPGIQISDPAQEPRSEGLFEKPERPLTVEPRELLPPSVVEHTTHRLSSESVALSPKALINDRR